MTAISSIALVWYGMLCHWAEAVTDEQGSSTRLLQATVSKNSHTASIDTYIPKTTPKDSNVFLKMGSYAMYSPDTGLPS